MSGLVTSHVTDRVGVLSFNRPDKHNALSDELLAEWRVALGALARDAGVRAIVLRGEGPSFSSGRDITQLGRRPHGESDAEFVGREQQEALALRRIPKPVVAALRGWVLGGALELALHADLRVAAPDARLGLPEIGFDILPDLGGIALLHALIGPERTKHLVLTGETISGETAALWGLVSELVADDELDAHAGAIATVLADRDPAAVERAKALVDSLTDEQLEQEMANELRTQVELFGRRARGAP